VIPPTCSAGEAKLAKIFAQFLGFIEGSPTQEEETPGHTGVIFHSVRCRTASKARLEKSTRLTRDSNQAVVSEARNLFSSVFPSLPNTLFPLPTHGVF
jgi:hypothetical protein